MPSKRKNKFEESDQEPDIATDPDEFLDFLGSLRERVEEECAVQPDIIKAGLQRIASGLDTLKDNRATWANLERSHD